MWHDNDKVSLFRQFLHASYYARESCLERMITDESDIASICGNNCIECFLIPWISEPLNTCLGEIFLCLLESLRAEIIRVIVRQTYDFDMSLRQNSCRFRIECECKRFREFTVW